MNFNLDRFIEAQDKSYPSALQEIRDGKKRTHWMWFIFPQILGLGRSPIAVYYSIQNRAEARAYIENETLRNRLLEISQALLDCNQNNATEIMGFPDDLKLKSSMTLFAEIAPEYSLFQKVLDKFYNGEKDESTLKILSI